MTRTERRNYLIKSLLDEQPRYKGMTVPKNTAEQKNMLRALLKIRMPENISNEFLAVQDAYLQEETAAKGITDFADLSPISEELYLWQGDITTLHCDAIVNAANSGMTGCYVPCHACIANCIPTKHVRNYFLVAFPQRKMYNKSSKTIYIGKTGSSVP